MTAALALRAELVLGAAVRVDALAAWVRAVHARAAMVDPGEERFLVLTPLGWPDRERLAGRLVAHGVAVLRSASLPDWPRLATALRVTRLDAARLRRAARFEAVWESLHPGGLAEAWALTPEGFLRAVALKRALRGMLRSRAVDLGDGSALPAVLHPFHLADPCDAREEARRLMAAVDLLSQEARRWPRRAAPPRVA